MVKTSLDIISDPVCPWCYIGKTRLDRALAARGGSALDISWRIFQLNPDMPAEGMDRRAYLERKFGGPEGADRVYGSIRDACTEAGLDVAFDKITRQPNTFDAHRLIYWAGEAGAQGPVVDALFQRYFHEGDDIGSHAVLLDIAGQAGLDPSEIMARYRADADRDTLKNEEALARQMGVTGVPTFVLGEQYAMVGAQEEAAWLQVLDKLGEPRDDAPHDN